MITPKTALILNLILGICSGLIALGSQVLQSAGLPGADAILAWAAILTMVVNVVLHAYSSPAPGPMAARKLDEQG